MRRQRLYFIYSGPMDSIKIGVSGDPWKRMRALGLPNLRLVATIASPDARGLERDLHWQFGHLRRGKSEWFRATPELWAFIESVRG